MHTNRLKEQERSSIQISHHFWVSRIQELMAWSKTSSVSKNLKKLFFLWGQTMNRERVTSTAYGKRGLQSFQLKTWVLSRDLSIWEALSLRKLMKLINTSTLPTLHRTLATTTLVKRFWTNSSSILSKRRMFLALTRINKEDSKMNWRKWKCQFLKTTTTWVSKNKQSWKSKRWSKITK